MRTRLTFLVAAVAAALLIPSSAFASPVITSPALWTPPVTGGATSLASLNIEWTDSNSSEISFDLWRYDASGSDCLTGLSNPQNLSGLLPASASTWPDSPPEGTYCYFVKADDTVTQTQSPGVMITFDSTRPTGSITAPAPGATLSTLSVPLNLTVSANDSGSGVAQVEYFAKPTSGLGTFASIGVSSTAPFSLSWSPTDDTYDIQAVITDKAGNSFTTPTVGGVVVDGTLPAGTLTFPTSSDVLHGSSNTLSANASDASTGVATVRFQRFVTGSWTTIATSGDSSSPYTANWNTTGINGTFDLRVVVIDGAGNEFDGTGVPVVVDNTAPAVSVNAPTTSSTVHGASVSLSADATDAGSGVTGVTFWSQLGVGSPVQIGSSSGPGPTYTATWNTTSGVADGVYSVFAIATDGATLTTTSTAIASVRVDNTAPAVSVNAPTTSSTVHGASVSLSADATDAGSGVTGVTFWSQLGVGSPVQIGSSSGPGPTYTATWNTTSGVADGVYSVFAIATDGATLTTTSTAIASVRVDNTAPAVSVNAPTTSSTVHGASVSLSADATDAGSGVTGVTFWSQLGVGSPVQIGSSSGPGPTYTATWNTTSGVADGVYSVFAIATDGATLTTTSTAIASVRVDNTAPTRPTANGLSPVSAAPTISFASTDAGSGIGHYDVYRDTGGGPVKVNVAGIGAGTLSWSDVAGQSTAPASGQGTYIYTVVAVDVATNQSTPSLPVSIFMDPSGASAPTAVATAATPTNQRPQLSWTAPASPGFTVQHYKVYRDGAFLTDVPGTTFTDSSVTSLSLADATYTYQVVAASSGDTTLGIASAPVVVTYDTTPPTTPPATSASAALDGSIGIGWGASSDNGSGVARYVVRRALSSVAPATIADGDAVCQGLVTSCADTTAVNGKLYSYAVFAVDAAGNVSVAGTALSITARDQLPPAAPTGLTATPGDATVALSWAGAAADVTGYELVVKPGVSAPTSDTDGTRVCGTIVAASTTCTATGLTNGASYTFALFALDEALNRSAAAVVTAVPNGKVSDTTAPGAVKGLTAKVSGRTITLSWKNPSDKDFDHVVITASDRKPASQKASQRVYSGTGTKAKTTLAAGASRWYVVVAYDHVGNASAPATVHAAVASASPFGPAPSAKVHGAVKLSWPVAKGAKYYNVQIYAGSKRVLVSWPAGRAMTLPKAKLKRGTKYTWYVWPGLGAKAKAHYGKLIGKNVFTYAG